ncbi:hypothetical protein M0R01_03625 [bacterium]|nr:hypothetical protein [bacterium]
MAPKFNTGIVDLLGYDLIKSFFEFNLRSKNSLGDTFYGMECKICGEGFESDSYANQRDHIKQHLHQEEIEEAKKYLTGLIKVSKKIHTLGKIPLHNLSIRRTV